MAEAFPHKLPYARAEPIVSQALAGAEVKHHQFYASVKPELRHRPRFEDLCTSLAEFCDDGPLGGSPQREIKGTMEAELRLDAALTRALVYLWVYFDDECATRAEQV